MNLLTSDIPIKAGRTGYNYFLELEANKKYVMSDTMVKQLRDLYGKGHFNVEPFFIQTTGDVKKAKRILIYRSGGVGDLLFLFPYLEEIKRVNPTCHLAFATLSQNIPLFELTPAIDEIVVEPMALDKIMEFDHVIMLINFIENNKQAEAANAYDIAKQFIGLSRGEIKSNKQIAKPSKNSKIKVLIQHNASTLVRDINPVTWWEFVRLLDSRFKVEFIGAELQRESIEETVKMIHRNAPITLPEVGIFTSTSMKDTIEHIFNSEAHCLIGPDSGLVHLAGYHEMPVIGIYGPFPSVLRLKYYNYAIGLEAKNNCPFSKNERGNCFEHDGNHCKLANTRNEIYSPCIELIHAGHIYEGLNTLLKDNYNIEI
jgi:ADP-heptose:LPS heptosyltransferase